jgi:hypothetical protein
MSRPNVEPTLRLSVHIKTQFLNHFKTFRAFGDPVLNPFSDSLRMLRPNLKPLLGLSEHVVTQF